MNSRAEKQLQPAEIPAKIRPAFAALLEAARYADQTSGDVWEFAVEMDHLCTMGLTQNDFRWLVRQGWVEHQREVTLESDDGRSFRPTGDLTFPCGSCFVLTDSGTQIASVVCRANSSQTPGATQVGTHNEETTRVADNAERARSSGPKWDSDTRELRVDATIVKRFKWAAVNQETILSVFEEEGWPARIDDPLPPQPEQDPKRRLSDTIKCLNRKQSNHLIHFRGDGNGEGVIWEIVEQNGSNGKTNR